MGPIIAGGWMAYFFETQYRTENVIQHLRSSDKSISVCAASRRALSAPRRGDFVKYITQLSGFSSGATDARVALSLHNSARHTHAHTHTHTHLSCDYSFLRPCTSISLLTKHTLQVALLWQRDRATRLSVEILQLLNIPFEN